MLSVYKARSLARNYLKENGAFNMKATHVHHLGMYKQFYAFEVLIDIPDGLCVDLGLPIIILVSDNEIYLIQSEESYKIIENCKTTPHV